MKNYIDNNAKQSKKKLNTHDIIVLKLYGVAKTTTTTAATKKIVQVETSEKTLHAKVQQLQYIAGLWVKTIESS